MKVLLLCDQDEEYINKPYSLYYAISQLKLLQKVFGKDADTIQLQNFTKWSGSLEYTTLLARELQSINILDYDFIIGCGDLFFDRLFKPKFINPIMFQQMFPKKNLVQFDASPTINVANYGLYHLESSSPSNKCEYVGHCVPSEYLYIEEKTTDRINVFVDHAMPKRNDITNEILSYLEKVQKDYPIDVYHQNTTEITKNVFVNNSMSYAVYPIEELHSIYRKMDVAFPTHRETMGSFAPELALCGAINVIKNGMYPQSIKKYFPHMSYNSFDEIDWNEILRKTTEKETIRQETLKHYSIESYRNRIYNALERFLKR